MLTGKRSSGRSENHNLYTEKLSFLLLQIISLFFFFVNTSDILLKSRDPIAAKLLFSLAGQLSVNYYSFIYFTIYTLTCTVIVFILKNRLQMLIFAVLYLFSILTAPLLGSNLNIWLLLLLSPLLLLITRDTQYNILLLSIFFVLGNNFLFYQPTYSSLIPSVEYMQSRSITCDDSSYVNGIMLNYQKIVTAGSHICHMEDNFFKIPGLYLPISDGGVIHVQKND